MEGYPAARHVNTVLNDRIDGLPENFDGVFMLEESDYTVNGRTNPMPHLFLFTLEPGGRVKLTSYDMPAPYTKETFRAESLGRLNYADLTPSAKFTPALYEYRDGGWEGGSESMFTPVLKFKLWERFTPEVLVVSESMEMNGKRTFGYYTVCFTEDIMEDCFGVDITFDPQRQAYIAQRKDAPAG